MTKISKDFKIIKLVQYYFTTALEFYKYLLNKQFQEYNSYVPEKAKWTKRIDVKMRSAASKPSDFIHVLCFMHSYETACESRKLYESTAI